MRKLFSSPRVLARTEPEAAAAMDRLRRRNPRTGGHSSSSSLKPPRPPAASRGLPDPSFLGVGPRKKVRFASEASSHQIYMRQDANTSKVDKNRPQDCGAKTTEYRFFKKLQEQSGCRFHSFSKQNKDTRMESHNKMPYRKFPGQKSTLCSEEAPVTPSKNEEIYHEQVIASHPDTPQLNPYDDLTTVHVLTPIIPTSFEAVGISRNTGIELWSGRIFSGKRRKLVKLAAKTVSMESPEFLQKRSEFFAGIMQRLGVNMIKKNHEESMGLTKMVCGHTPTGPRCRSENMIDYSHSDFDLLTKLRTGKESSSYATPQACQLTTLPSRHSQSLSNSLDWKIDLLHGGNDKARECMALPWVHTASLLSIGWKSDTAHNQISNLLLEDIQPQTKGRPASASELNCNVETRPCDYHGWESMLSARLAGSIPNVFSFPCQIEEKHVVPYAISNTFWQPNLHSPLEQCFSSSVELEGQRKEVRFSHSYGAGHLEQCNSSSVGLEGQYQHEEGLFNSDVGCLSSFDQLYAKCTATSILDTKSHNDGGYISNLLTTESNNVVLNANRSCLNSIFSTSEHPFQSGSKSLDDSAVNISFAGLEEKYSAEVGLCDNSAICPIQGLDQSPAKFTATSFSNYTSGILDHHHLRFMSNCPPKDNVSTLFVDAEDTCLNSLSSYPDHPCKQDGKSLYDSSTELWSSVHHLQSYGYDLGSVLGFMSDESMYNDHYNATLVEGNPKELCTSNLSFFVSSSAIDGIRETPTFSPDSPRW